MKLASFRAGSTESFGIITDMGVIDLKKRLGNKHNVKSFLVDDGMEALVLPTDNIDYSLEQISFLPVIPNPNKIICVGLNYREHREEEEVGREESEYPTIFLRVASSQIGHQDDLLLPKESSMLDYEGEIAVVIGKRGRRINQEEAYDLAGYSCYNDGSIRRDWQLRTDQWRPGKNFDGTGAFGPWMVTKEEIKDGEALSLETRVNGEVV